MKSRIAQSNPEDSIKSKLVDSLYNHKNESNRIFYFAQVISNEDPFNLNRIKVRIPVVDDIYYINQTKAQGDTNLPWCLPESSRFINTPEQNTIVVVAIFDPKIPFFGRLFLDCITDLSTTDLFEKLSPEDKTQSNWLNANKTLEINNPKPKKDNEYEVLNKVKYPVGVRGKGKNKLQFNEKDTLLTQNHKDKDKESYLFLEENKSTLEAANELHLKSKKGDKTEFNVVFDKKLFDFLEKQNRMIAKLVAQFNSIPAKSASGPCTPAPNAKNLISEFKTLKAEFKKFKENGSSKKIFIN